MNDRKILPRRLYEKACEIREQTMEPASDYKDSAALWSRALGEAANFLGCADVLVELGMPDGFNCPRAFDAWWCNDIEVEPVPTEEEALRDLETGLKFANADFNPEWFDMGTAAMCAMEEYPDWLAWEANHGKDVETLGDDIRIDMASTKAFRDFLIAWVRERRNDGKDDK